MTTVFSLGSMLGVVTGLLPLWVWLAVCAVVGVRSSRGAWIHIGVACLVIELMLPIRIGELSVPLLVSVGLVAVARRFMADVGVFERRGSMVSCVVVGLCVVASSLASRGIGTAVYGGAFWYGMVSVELLYAWLLALVWLIGSSVRYYHATS
jgi:hypothetical protein